MSRYLELVEAAPRGSWYDATGHELPVRDAPYELVFTDPTAPNIEFIVTVNGRTVGTATTDAAGVAVVTVTLDPGDSAIQLTSSVNKQSAHVTVRHRATWYAAYAESFEGTPTTTGLDVATESVLNATRLESADGRHIEDAHGQGLRQSNDAGYLIETYRKALRGLRQGYRLWGGKLAGLRQVVGEIASVLPWFVPRQWRPRWELGTALNADASLQQHSGGLDPSVMTDRLTWPTLNARSINWVHASFLDNVAVPAGPFGQPPEPQVLLVSFSAGWAGGDVTVIGTSPGGDVLSEVFPDPAVLPGRVLGVEIFATVTAITSAAAGAGVGNAAVGLGVSRFVTFVRADGPGVYNVSFPLALNQNADGDDVLIVGSTSVTFPSQPVLIPTDGEYELDYLLTPRFLVGLVRLANAGVATFTLGSAIRLWLEFGNHGPLEVVLTATPTINGVVTAINAALAASPYTAGIGAAAFGGTSTLGEFAVSVFGTNYPRASDGVPVVRLLRGPKDAGLLIFGMPRYRATANGAIVGFDLSVPFTTAGNGLPRGVPTNYRMGRGLQVSGTNVGAIQNSANREADFLLTGTNFLVHSAFVHAAFLDNVASPITTGITSPPSPTRLVVVMDAAWAGGIVTVFGTGTDGAVVSEAFAAGTSVTRFGSTEFVTVTSITRSLAGAGAGSATVGLRLFRDQSGHVFISGAGTAANNGLHEIVDVLNIDRLRIRHHDVGGVFVNEAAGAIDYELWTPGEVVTATANSGTVLTIGGVGVVFPRASGVLIELEEELPRTRTADPAGGTMTVEVDLDMRPTAGLPLSDATRLIGSGVPLTTTFSAVTVAAGNATFTVPAAHNFAPNMLVWSQELAGGTTWDNGAGDDIPQSTPIEIGSVGATTVVVPYAGTGLTDAAATGVLRIDRSIPDGWSVSTGTAADIARDGWLDISRLVLTRGGTNEITADVAVPRAVPEFVGLLLRVSAWVQQFNSAATQNFTLQVSSNSGGAYTTIATLAVAGTLYESSTGGGALNPTQITGTVMLPLTSTGMRVRIGHTGSAGHQVSLARVEVRAETATGLHLGTNTVARTRRREYFGELVYVWVPPEGGVTGVLTTAEEIQVGLPQVGDALASVPDVAGHIDFVTTAHGVWERFDVSEATNVAVSTTAVDWLGATLNNMEIVVGSPDRLSYVQPNVVSRVVGEVLSPNGAGVANLLETTTHDGPYPQDPNGTSRLYENTIPVPDDDDISAVLPYVFSAANQIDMSVAEFDAAAAYVIDYDRLIRATTPVLDLGATFADYMWLVQATAWQRTDLTLGERDVDRSVVFGANLRADLDLPSNQDKVASTLTADNGVDSRVVPEGAWEYIDNSTISIDSNEFDTTEVYTLSYTSVFNAFARVPTMVIEHRAAATSGAVAAVAWTVADIDDVVDNSLQFHQLRTTFTNVASLTDVRLSSLGLRGAHLYGASPNAPGIIVA